MAVRVVAVAILNIVPLIDLSHLDAERFEPQLFSSHVLCSKNKLNAAVGSAINLESELVKRNRAASRIDLDPFVVKLYLLETYDRVWPALDVDGIDKSNAFGIRRHHNRVRAFARAKKSDATKQRTIRNTCSGKYYLFARC